MNKYNFKKKKICHVLKNIKRHMVLEKVSYV